MIKINEVDKLAVRLTIGGIALHKIEIQCVVDLLSYYVTMDDEY
jgi:hypothetical protein